MTNRVSILISLLFLVITSSSYCQYVIKGKLVGGNGQPMKMADIVLISNDTKSPPDVLGKFKVNANGNFEFDIHRKGVHRIWFCGVGHSAYLIPFYLGKPDTTIINVQLQSGFNKDIKRITVRAAYNPKTWKYSLTDTLYLKGDATIKKTYKGYGPKFEYELNETGEGNYFAGTQVDYYSFDCDSTFENKYNYYYTNVINTVKDSIFQFEFAPSKFLLNQVKENYTFQKADDKTIKLLKMDTIYENAWNAYIKYANGARKRGLGNDSINAYSWEKNLKDLDNKIKTEKDPFLKNCWIVASIKIASIDAFGKKESKMTKELGQLALNNIKPDSPIWSYFAPAASIAAGRASGLDKNRADSKNDKLKITGINSPYLNYLISVLEKHPDPSIRKSIYYGVIGNASKEGRNDLVVYYLDKFKEEFTREMDRKHMIDSYSPNRIIKDNNKVPPFEFASIHDTTKIISNMDMLGKKYLIHVWADWCGPCRKEVEAIRNMNNQFSGKNFSVLSVSICFTKENLLNFQKDHPMPWFNTHVDMRNDKTGFMKDFEVSTIPKDILVDEKGTIITVNNLDKVLEILKQNK